MEILNRPQTRLILIRHGETDWNIEGRYQGQEDPPLNEQGLKQARQLARDIAKLDIDVLYSSPLLRASQTAEIIQLHLNIPLFIEPRLKEIHQGDWQSRLRSEIERLYPDLFRRWETDPWEVTPPNGESLYQVQTRVHEALEEILARHANRSIGIVAHRIPLALIKMRYQDLDPNIVRTLNMPNTYYEEIRLETEEN